MKKAIWRINLLLFVGSVILALYLPYFWLNNRVTIGFVHFFIKFSVIAVPILVIWLGLILTKGDWIAIKKHVRVLLVAVAIFLVATSILFKWTSVVNMYGVPGHYVKNAESMEQWFKGALVDQDSSSFEKHVAYKEMMDSVYDREFKKMWTFSAFVFLSTFLLLTVIPKKKE